MQSFSKPCPQCERNIPIDSMFCPHCGHHFSDRGEQETVKIPSKRFKGYLTADLEMVIGNNYELYMDKLHRMHRGKLCFNWSAALLGFWWIAYRKMWRLWGAAFLVITGLCLIYCMFSRDLNLSAHGRELSIEMDRAMHFTILRVLNLTAYDIELSIGIDAGLLILLIRMIVFGLLGDRLYWLHVKKVLDCRRCRGRKPVFDQHLAEELTKDGGTLSSADMVLSVIAMEFLFWNMKLIGNALGGV